MKISDFSAFIQLSATFCAAYVVIDYAKSFMKALTDNVFSFKKRYSDELDEVVNLIDENSMEQLKNKQSFYRGGNVLICEEVMAEIGKLKKEVNEFTKSIDAKVENHCRIRGFGSICAYCFLFAITQLLLIGVFPLLPRVLMKFWLSLTMVSIFLISAYWLFVFVNLEGKGQRFKKWSERLQKGIDYNANGMIFYAGAFLLSSFLCFVHISILQPYFDIIWSSVWVLSVLLSPISFIICALTVWRRARKVKTEFSEFKKKKEVERNMINVRIVRLKNAQETLDEAEQKLAEANAEQ